MRWLASAVPVFAAATLLSAQAPPAVDRAELLRDVRVLSADDMAGREIGTPGGERARGYIVQRFEAVGLEPVGGAFVHPFTTPSRGQSGGQAGANVLGRLTGTQAPARVLVISAHYDHVGVRAGDVFNGADDNASGTAALFAIARHFLRRPPGQTLLFAAFDGEEVGLAGSRAFVRSPPIPRAAIVLNVNVDMIGRDADDVLFVAGTHAFPALRPMMAEVAARAPVRLRLGHDDPAGREADWTRQSDQYAFIEAGIPALLFSVDDEQHHHRPTDDYDTLTHDFYVRAVETIIDAIEALDRGLLAGPTGAGGRSAAEGSVRAR